jgi:hypothetical protein
MLMPMPPAAMRVMAMLHLHRQQMELPVPHAALARCLGGEGADF